MYDKAGLIMLIIQGLALLYEVSLKGPNKYGEALDLFNQVGVQREAKIVACPDPAPTMAKAFLDCFYAGGDVPDWMKP